MDIYPASILPPTDEASTLFEALLADEASREPRGQSSKQRELDLTSAGQPNELPSYPFNGRLSPSETRQELIERIKRTQRLPWQNETEPTFSGTSPTQKPPGAYPSSSSLLPPAEIHQHNESFTQDHQESLAHPASIERPRSALHSGDFRDKPTKPLSDTPLRQPGTPNTPWLSTSPTSPWYTANLFKNDNFSQGPSIETARTPAQRHTRTRAASYTARSNSFAFLPPTSPLANELDNTSSQLRPRSPDRSRRHTFSPHSFQTYRRSPLTPENLKFSASNSSSYHPRRGNSYPYQAHQPRRSITSTAQLLLPNSTPHTPRLGARRPSISSDTSPLHHAPMVGSYEQSILRGRMSTTPSRPLDFVAQIGVLGKGKCKASKVTQSLSTRTREEMVNRTF